jgi:tetratricopeptide (TPR) repeat protein
MTRRCEISPPDKNNSVVRIVSIVLGALSLIIPFAVFFRTMAATLSFWDCGEFIAAANILGNPHPPGTPFFVILGRLFIILAPFENVAQRTNIISVASSAITAFLAYLLVVRISRRLPFGQHGSSLLGQIGIRIGAFSSALLLAFSSTFWFNAVETEVYGLAMLVMVLSIYLAVKWADEKAEGGSDRLIIFVTYLLFLSIGIHLTGFLVVPAFVIFFALIDRKKLKDPVYWITWAILFSIAVPFYFVIGLVIPRVQENSYLIWVALMILGVAVTGIMAYRYRSSRAIRGRANYGLAFALFLVAILGYSNHIYIPIRAVQNPAINENNPSTLDGFVSFLERKQYGQESMISRMFYRRGKLSNQFGRHENMGFGGYFWDQYASNWAAGLLRYLIFAFGILGSVVGIYYAFKRLTFHPSVLLLIIFFLSSVMLVLYMNFADGTRPDPANPGSLIPLEVRERDYFFTPAFVTFAVIIGTGISSILYLIGTGLKFGSRSWSRFIRYAAFAVAGIFFLLLPIDPATANFKSHDRDQDFVPIDYAYNILQSCEPDAILFTNGDNDTFPLWYIQEVDQVRKDVRVVNLSLLNTDWYILQLKRSSENGGMGLNMFLEDNQIKWIPADRRGSIIYYRPAERFYDSIRRQMRYLTPTQDPRTGRFMRVQDQMIEQLVIANLDKPIYFSGSVPASNRWTLTDRLIRHGIVLKVDPDTTKPRYNIPVSDSLITRVYRYRGLNDLDAYKDDNNVGLTTTFPERFCELSDAHKSAGDTARAIEVLWEAIERVPYYHQIYVNLQQAYAELGDTAMVDSVKTVGLSKLKEAAEARPGVILYQQFLGVLYYNNGMPDSALVHYKNAYELQPNNAIAFRLLRDLTLQMQQRADAEADLTGSEEARMKSKRLGEEAKAMMEDWNRRHPEDIDARSLFNRFRNL